MVKVLSSYNRSANRRGGVGKEVVARMIHASPAKDNVFLPVNCSAIPENLLESQLLAMKVHLPVPSISRGAFQRARRDDLSGRNRRNAFEPAAKILRVLEEKTVLPVGSTTR
jgi:transcriptional regulator with GAF, ATPase, and Fis domain